MKKVEVSKKKTIVIVYTPGVWLIGQAPQKHALVHPCLPLYEAGMFIARQEEQEEGKVMVGFLLRGIGINLGPVTKLHVNSSIGFPVSDDAMGAAVAKEIRTRYLTFTDRAAHDRSRDIQVPPPGSTLGVQGNQGPTQDALLQHILKSGKSEEEAKKLLAAMKGGNL
jgi:hypothetical protein